MHSLKFSAVTAENVNAAIVSTSVLVLPFHIVMSVSTPAQLAVAVDASNITTKDRHH